MKSARFLQNLPFALLAATLSLPAAAETFGKPLKGLKPVSLAEVLSKPEAGRIVRLEGTIERVCENKGCWLGFKQGEQAVHVTFEGYSFFVPKDSKGRKVILEGKVLVKERSKDEIEHLESEGAKGAASRVSIEATGVEITSAK